jgi:hypothetical protein
LQSPLRNDRNLIMRIPAALIAIALGISLGVAGCTAQPASREADATAAPASTAPERDESAEQNATIEAFVSAVFEDRYDEARQHASPGSPAERYITHQEAIDTALTANGDGQAGTTTEPTLTFEDGVPTIVEPGANEFTLTDFTFDENGLVVAWTGKSGPVGDVLWTTPWTGQTGGNTVELVSAYKTNSGALQAVLKVTANERATSPYGYSSTYSASDGITYSVEWASQPQDIAAGSAAYIVVSFPGAPFGGTINLDGSSPDDYSLSWAAQVPVS